MQDKTAEPEEATGGVFRRLWSDPPTLDPHLTTDTTSSGVVVELFSGLVTMNTDLQLVPDIAESWDIDDTGTVYTFHLRKNAKFHDGKPITAHDVKWSLERAVHPDTASPVADTYLNDIIGVEKALEGETTEIEGVKVIDDHTIEFRIDAPKAYFLAKLTYPTAFVLDKENVEAGGRNWTENPNGTGPFRLAEYKIGERIILERNENFYRQPAHVDSISMNLAGGQAMAMYENDEIDITGVGLFDLDRVLDPSEDLNKELIIAPPDFSVSYVGFNTSMPPFDDPKFRQALNHAVDKELIATEVLSELVEPAYGILPPGFPGYNENLVGLEYDPEFARQLLAESKYADPDTRPRIEVTVPGTGGTIGLDLEVIIEMWRQELGVEVEIQQVEWAHLPRRPEPAEVPGLRRSRLAGRLPRPAGLPRHPLPHREFYQSRRLLQRRTRRHFGRGAHRSRPGEARKPLSPGRKDDSGRRRLAAPLVRRRTLRPDKVLRRKLPRYPHDNPQAQRDPHHRR